MQLEQTQQTELIGLGGDEISFEQNQSSLEQKQQNDKLLSEPVIEQEQTINFWQQVQVGNFGLVFQVLPDDINRLDQQGYSLMHYAVTYNNMEAIKILIYEYKADPDLPSKSGQTPLSIACNYGYIEISKLLILNGANLNSYDGYKFTPLLYAVKGKHYALVIFLLVKGAQLDGLIDANGCSVLHWASYNNDIFMLRFIKAIGTQIDLLDKQGLSPLGRSSQGLSYKALNFLIETYPEMIQYGFTRGQSKSIDEMLNVQ